MASLFHRAKDKGKAWALTLAATFWVAGANRQVTKKLSGLQVTISSQGWDSNKGIRESIMADDRNVIEISGQQSLDRKCQGL